MNAASSGFVGAAFVAPFLFWACFEWHWWFLLASVVILAFALIVWLALPRSPEGPEGPPPPPTTPTPPRSFAPDSAAAETHRLLEFAFPDARVRAMVKKDLALAAWDRGRRDYAERLLGRSRRPD